GRALVFGLGARTPFFEASVTREPPIKSMFDKTIVRACIEICGAENAVELMPRVSRALRSTALADTKPPPVMVSDGQEREIPPLVFSNVTLVRLSGLPFNRPVSMVSPLLPPMLIPSFE